LRAGAVVGYRLVVVGYRLAVARYRLAVAGYRLAAAGNRFAVAATFTTGGEALSPECNAPPVHARTREGDAHPHDASFSHRAWS
jgi:hypothetical protein